MQFWPILGPYDPLRAPLLYQQKHLRVQILPKVSINCNYQKKNSFISFWSENVWEVPKMSYFMQFWPIFGPYYPLKNPLHYQRSSLKGSYSPKILHKIVLPENGFISIFFEVKIIKKCPKCHISCNFDQFWDHMTHSKAPYTTNEVR